MRFRATLPRLTSTVQTSPNAFDHEPILDGHLPIYTNVWRVPPNTVALCGRPAVWFALDVRIPGFRIGPLRANPRRIRWEQDVGGHLYIVVVGDAPADAIVLEGGPFVTGTGALAPYAYSEDGFFNKGMVDFDPVPIDPPNGLTSQEFAELLFTAHREYDANQRYTAIEIPFLRVGRDSNSYAIGMLLAAGLDFRALSQNRIVRVALSGPDIRVPRIPCIARTSAAISVSRARCPTDRKRRRSTAIADRSRTSASLANRTARRRLPDGTDVALDAFGRRVLGRAEAVRHGLPIKHTAPPEHIANRRALSEKPDPAGAYITLVDNGVSTALELGKTYSGTIVERDDALGLATMAHRGRPNRHDADERTRRRTARSQACGRRAASRRVSPHRSPQRSAPSATRSRASRRWSECLPDRAGSGRRAAAVFAVLAVAGVLVYRSVRE